MIQYAERIAAQQECLESVERRTEVNEKLLRHLSSDVSEIRADVRTLMTITMDSGTIRLTTKQAAGIIMAVVIAVLMLLGIDVGVLP